MNFLHVLKEAWTSIAANRMRSFLTILGIIIGVGAVIALLAIGQGAQASIAGQIESIGTNVLYVMPGNIMEDITNPQKLTLSDVSNLSNRARAPHIARVAPVLFSSTTITYGNDTLSTNVTGSTPDIQQILNLEIQEGSFFTETQQSARASVIVIGPRAAERLTGKSTGVVGTVLRINGHPFRVVGVTKPKGGNQFSSPDYMIYMPISSMQMRVKSSAGSEEVDYIIVQAQDSQSMTLAIQETREIMRSSHRLTPRQPDDFTITNQEDFLSIANSITQILTIMLSGIGGISLLVGGIGIMNMMLVTVTERTREIGLRKALGARKSDILLQFLTESAMLSLIGGVIGIAFGWGLSSLVGLIAVNSGAPLAPVIGVSSILLATLFSAAVGVFFGWYPARRAANLQPVEALRYE